MVEIGGAAAGLDIPPPPQVAVGKGNAFVIAGYCLQSGERTRALQVQVGESRQRVVQFGLPRSDVYGDLNSNGRQAFRSGFVAMPDLAPVGRAESLEISAVLTLRAGREATVRLGSLDVEPGLAAPPQAGAARFSDRSAPRVAICMATYEPPADLLRRQLDSLREQTHPNWVCLVSDDCSSPETIGRLEAEVRDDPRFVLSRGPRRLGYYRNFERALSMVPRDADFVTLCDQDDRWHPGKLERLLEGIGEAQLVYSDARVVDPCGALVSPSYWTERRNNYTNFGSLLLANSITGAAALFRRELLDDALPFPPELAKPFHDHWLAVVALARGEVAYLDEPLYDYVQHEGAVIGHSGANIRPRPIRRHLIERLRNPTGGARAVYYYHWYQQLLFAEVLRLRCWEPMAPAKRRTLRRLLSADHGVRGLAWLLARRTRRFWGHDETLDRELFYAHALLRRRAASLWALGRRRPSRILPRDQSVPPTPDHRPPDPTRETGVPG